MNKARPPIISPTNREKVAVKAIAKGTYLALLSHS